MKNQEEHLAIHALVARYTEALLRSDPDAWGATWAKDATWDLAGFVVEGVDAIVDLWLKAIASFAFIVQTESNPVLRIDDDGLGAQGRWTVEEFLGTADGATMHNIGIYDDDYRVIDGEWRFARRRFQAVFSGSATLTAAPTGFPVISPMG